MPEGFDKETQRGICIIGKGSQPHMQCLTHSRYSVSFSQVMNHVDQVFQYIRLELTFIYKALV